MAEDLTITISAKKIYDDLKELKSLAKEMIGHQKYTNGNVTQNTSDIKDAKDEIKELQLFKGKTMVIWGLVVIAFSAALSYGVHALFDKIYS